LISRVARIFPTLGIISVLTAIFLGGSTTSPASAAEAPKITQHYNGKLLPWDKETWNGAKICTVASATDVYCFDTAAEAEAFNSEQAQAAPASTQGYNCSGTTSLNGDGGRILNFHDWGYWQNLSQWVRVPFNVAAWSNPNSCKAYIRYAGGACAYIAPNFYEIDFIPPRPTDQIFLQNPSYAPAPGC
jgi:hypothetical protein